jgi:hypothetical protein
VRQRKDELQKLQSIQNIIVDGDEFTAGALGLDWFPSAGASAAKRDYETGVMNILNKLLHTWTGWAVMMEIFHTNHKKMIIRPYHPTAGAGQYNATAGASDVKAATMKDTTASYGQGSGSATQNSPIITTGQEFYAGNRIKIQGTRAGKPYSMTFKYRVDSSTQITLLAYSVPSYPDDTFNVKWEGDTGLVTWIVYGAPGQEAVVGTGSGSDTEIRFSVSTWTATGAPTGPGAKPDEILLHEMVHGVRQMMGRAVFEQISGNPGMDNYEEFVAIVTSNVYRSEMGTAQLRKDHHGFLSLTGPETSAATFKSTYSSYMSYVASSSPSFTRICKRSNARLIHFFEM